MVNLALFRLPRFIGAVLAMFAYAASAQVMAQLLPLYLQNGLGLPPLDAGLAMLPFAIAMLILPQIGRWLDRHLAAYQILAAVISPPIKFLRSGSPLSVSVTSSQPGARQAAGGRSSFSA